MIAGLIAWSLRNRFLVACAFLLTVAYGIIALRQAPVDAIPDLSENQVIVFADWPGRSPQEIEDQVTYPLSTNLQGLAGVREVRGISMFGFSLLTVIFEDSLDNYFARTRVLERLNFLGDTLPAGVIPRLGPDATGLGWVYQYYLDTADHDGGDIDLGKLRSIQDYFIRYQLSSVPGVAEVASIGGFVRQYQVAVSSDKMRAAQVSLQEVMAALADSNLNVGGKVIEENGQEFVVRGIGLVASVGDLKAWSSRPWTACPSICATWRVSASAASSAAGARRGRARGGGRNRDHAHGENAMAVIRGIRTRSPRSSPVSRTGDNQALL